MLEAQNRGRERRLAYAGFLITALNGMAGIIKKQKTVASQQSFAFLSVSIKLTAVKVFSFGAVELFVDSAG